MTNATIISIPAMGAIAKFLTRKIFHVISIPAMGAIVNNNKLYTAPFYINPRNGGNRLMGFSRGRGCGINPRNGGAIAIAIYLRSAKRISIPAMGGNRMLANNQLH